MTYVQNMKGSNILDLNWFGILREYVDYFQVATMKIIFSNRGSWLIKKRGITREIPLRGMTKELTAVLDLFKCSSPPRP